jgi:hypothetical protein
VVADVVFPTIVPFVYEIALMVVVPPALKVKFPVVSVTVANESVAAVREFPPKVTPPDPFKIKLDGYVINVLLGKVNAVVFVNLTVPLGA